jgi:serine/threonine protein phosphatase 1
LLYSEAMRARAIPAATSGTRDGREVRVYAVGDIHGRLDLLERLVDRIHIDVTLRPEASVRIVILGDFVDRGPSSATIIDLLTRLKAEPNVVVLRGNHEAIMLDAYDGDHSAMDLWLEHGGIATLESFGADLNGIDTDDTRAIIKIARRVIPRRVVAWVRKLPSHVQFGRYYFVHAGIRPGVPLAEQQDEDRLWIREAFTESSDDHGAVIVHGHTIYGEGVSFAPNRIGVDTGAYLTGILSAVAIQGDQLWTVDTGSVDTTMNETTSPYATRASIDADHADPAEKNVTRGKWLNLGKSGTTQQAGA